MALRPSVARQTSSSRASAFCVSGISVRRATSITALAKRTVPNEIIISSGVRHTCCRTPLT